MKIVLNKAEVLQDQDTDISIFIPAQQEQQKIEDRTAHATKQIKASKTCIPIKRNNMFPKQIYGKTRGETQSKRIRGVKPAITATPKRKQ